MLLDIFKGLVSLFMGIILGPILLIAYLLDKHEYVMDKWCDILYDLWAIGADKD